MQPAADRSPVVRQLWSQTDLQRRLERSWKRVMIEENLAYNGGTPDWYVADSRADLEQVFLLLRPSSKVSFYFAGPFHEVVADSTTKPLIRTAPGTDVLVGLRDEGALSVRMEYLLPEEILEIEDGTTVFWGPEPDPARKDPDCITVLLVDHDGVYRAKPH